MLQEMIEMLLEQCAEVDFTREVASAGGEEGAEALRVTLAVGRALNDRLLACVQEAASPTVRRSAPAARFCPVCIRGDGNACAAHCYGPERLGTTARAARGR